MAAYVVEVQSNPKLWLRFQPTTKNCHPERTRDLLFTGAGDNRSFASLRMTN